MTSKYEPVGEDEKYTEQLPRRSSTSTSDSTLLEEDINDVRHMKTSRSSSRWLWIVHAGLLMLSFTMFVSAMFTRASTLEFVKKYSAYCEFT